MSTLQSDLCLFTIKSRASTSSVSFENFASSNLKWASLLPTMKNGTDLSEDKLKKTCSSTRMSFAPLASVLATLDWPNFASGLCWLMSRRRARNRNAWCRLFSERSRSFSLEITVSSDQLSCAKKLEMLDCASRFLNGLSSSESGQFDYR